MEPGNAFAHPSEDRAEPAPVGTVRVEVTGSEEGRIDPTTGTWQRNEGKGSRHVRYVLEVSAKGQKIVVRRRWRQIVAFSDELQKLSKGWIAPTHPEDSWSESNRIKAGWRKPGFNEKKIAARRETLSAFFAAFSAWATRLATKESECVDFFDPEAHPRLQKIREFLVGPDSLENDDDAQDVDQAESVTPGTAALLGDSVEAVVSAGTPSAEPEPEPQLQSEGGQQVAGKSETTPQAEPMAEPQPAPVTNPAPASGLDDSVAIGAVRSC